MGSEDSTLDWRYFSKEVEVYKIVTQYKDFWVSEAQMKALWPAIADVSHKDKMVSIGDEAIRVFSILGVVKEKQRFCELPKELQKGLLKTENIFDEQELEGFSDGVRLLLSDREGLGDGR